MSAKIIDRPQSLSGMDVQFLKGVGPRRSEALAEVGIRTALDLLNYFPRKYLDRSRILKIREAGSSMIIPDEVTFVGRIKSVQAVGRGRRFLFVKFGDETGSMKCVWFNGVQYFMHAFKEGEYIAFSGHVTSYRGEACLVHPEYDHLEDESDEEFLHTGGIIPVYSTTEGLKRVGLDSRGLRRTIRKLITGIDDFIVPDDPIPARIVGTHSIMPLRKALEAIHFPSDPKQLDMALRRFKFEELLYLQLLLAIRRNLIVHSAGIKMKSDGRFVQRLTGELLPFKLTDSQRKVMSEIAADLKSDHPMHRLLQGDVGSGKTIVALLTILIAVENGYQAAFMAPTEILAAQHYETIWNYLNKLNVKCDLLIGGQNKSARNDIYNNISSGETSVVVGTHALIQETVKFSKLGLVVVDEQHRFGVLQRMTLQEKGSNPHLLVMTATPIPRTLSLTIYGDLDVSVIDEMPGGRKKIKTALRGESSRPKVYEFVRDQVVAGRQAFIVYPLVNETEKSDLKAATQSFIKLRDEVFRGFKVGLIHGQMTETEKNDIMFAFKKNAISILIATTVIEVGIDIPNATVMLIEHAERFGLSQLHQLRGRIGRGVHQSVCILMSDDKFLSEKDLQTREDTTAFRRMQIFTSTTDGFKIAEEDLILRGPGEFFGTRQSGLPPLKLADLIRDRDIISQTRKAAFKIADSDPQLREVQNAGLREVLLKNYKESLEFLTAS